MSHLGLIGRLCGVLTLLGTLAVTAPAQAADGENLLKNGGFELDDNADGAPDGWPKVMDGLRYENENGNPFLRLTVIEPGKVVMAYRPVTLTAEDKAFELSYRVRYEGVKVGKESWFDGRIMMNFKDGEKKVVKPSPSPPVFRGTSEGWQERSQKFVVPEGAVMLELMPTLFQAAAGTLDFDDFKLVRIDSSEVKSQASAASEGPAKPAARRAPGEPLIANGDFQALKDGAPVGWFKENTENVSVQTEGGDRFLRLRSTEPGKMVMVYREIPLMPEDKALELSYRVRYEGVKVGEKPWFDGRIMMNFKDASNQALRGAPAPNYKGTNSQWREVSVKFAVPEGATMLEFMPSLFQASAGTIDFADFRLTPIDPTSVPKKVEMKSPVVAAPPAGKLPPGLRVVGNQVQTVDGAAVWLQGLCVDSLEWSATGERVVQSVEVAIDQWKSNCIRLPVRETFWFGRSDYQSDGGADYRQIVDSAVNAAAGRGAYLVIDLHGFRAPTEAHAEFWKDVATRYKDHPAVLLELFNEPHSLTWDQWRDGGLVTDKVKPKEGVAAENKEELKTFEAVGMQRLVDIVREAGARNIVIVGGLDWGYDLTGVMEGYALDDRGGNGIVYSTHVYPWKSGWQEKFLAAAEKHPLFIGEVGCPEKWEDFAFIPESQRHEKLGPEATWSQDMIGLIQKHKLHWTGFSFHPRCGPMVIKDWDYTPTPYWGVFVKDALAGKQFEMQRMR